MTLLQIKALKNDFCISNNSAAVLNDDNETLSFGEIKTEELTATISSIATNVTFEDSETEYTLVVSSVYSHLLILQLLHSIGLPLYSN